VTSHARRAGTKAKSEISLSVSIVLMTTHSVWVRRTLAWESARSTCIKQQISRAATVSRPAKAALELTLIARPASGKALFQISSLISASTNALEAGWVWTVSAQNVDHRVHSVMDTLISVSVVMVPVAQNMFTIRNALLTVPQALVPTLMNWLASRVLRAATSVIFKILRSALSAQRRV
jgi:hypothetical protein